MHNVMIDLETRGTRAGCAIVSIGLVQFDQKGLVSTVFYDVVNRKSCLEYGMHEDEKTMAWWDKQLPDARLALDESDQAGGKLPVVLEGVATFFKKDTRVWGNGSDFDNVILAKAYWLCGMAMPWNFYNNRCYRTIKSFYPHIKIDRGTGTHHNALSDARAQAEHLIKMLSPHA